LAEAQGQTSRQDTKSIQVLVREFFELAVAYLKQETLDPLKALGRFVAFGLAGAICLSTGAVLVGVGGLRALQRETNLHWTGDWSWLPYLIVVLFCLIVAGLAVSRIGKLPRGQAR
jgi:Putative Actinobacterial Holin-X, holin superfamily III